jgi:hypothetical protein
MNNKVALLFLIVCSVDLACKTFLKVVFFSIYFISFKVSQKRLVCYYTNWSQYRPEGGKFLPENIDPQLCNVVIFSFARISADKLAIYEWNDESKLTV